MGDVKVERRHLENAARIVKPRCTQEGMRVFCLSPTPQMERVAQALATAEASAQGEAGSVVNWAWACLDAYYLRENIAWPVFAELNDSESWVVMRNGDPIGWHDKDPNAARVMAAKHLYTEDPTSLPPPPKAEP